MEDENVLDLSGSGDSEALIQVIDLITEVLLDMADADALPNADLEELRLQMSEVATVILAEMDFQIREVAEDGTVTATLNPKGLG